jgi:hypothetical protein
MTDKLIIDDYLPSWDVEIAEHRLVHAPPEVTWRAARDLDLLTVRTPLLDMAFWVRSLPDRIARRPIPAPPALTFGGDGGAGVGLPGWVSLGQQENREIALGAVGKYWQPNITWRDVPVGEFRSFAEPGWGKIATAITTVPYGDGQTLLSYVCRTATTDSLSRHKFGRYWWLIRPFVAHIMRATLRAIAAKAEPSTSTVDG